MTRFSLLTKVQFFFTKTVWSNGYGADLIDEGYLAKGVAIPCIFITALNIYISVGDKINQNLKGVGEDGSLAVMIYFASPKIVRGDKQPGAFLHYKGKLTVSTLPIQRLGILRVKSGKTGFECFFTD